MSSKEKKKAVKAVETASKKLDVAERNKRNSLRKHQMTLATIHLKFSNEIAELEKKVSKGKISAKEAKNRYERLYEKYRKQGLKTRDQLLNGMESFVQRTKELEKANMEYKKLQGIKE